MINEPGQADDRITLAAPLKEFLAYYEAKLCTDINKLTEGHLVTLIKPLENKQHLKCIEIIHFLCRNQNQQLRRNGKQEHLL